MSEDEIEQLRALMPGLSWRQVEARTWEALCEGLLVRIRWTSMAPGPRLTLYTQADPTPPRLTRRLAYFDGMTVRAVVRAAQAHITGHLGELEGLQRLAAALASPDPTDS